MVTSRVPLKEGVALGAPDGELPIHVKRVHSAPAPAADQERVLVCRAEQVIGQSLIIDALGRDDPADAQSDEGERTVARRILSA
jgi:hypothetical protein